MASYSEPQPQQCITNHVVEFHCPRCEIVSCDKNFKLERVLNS